eukprot:4064010-Pyramimonas_sp.AAC.1
MAQEKRQYEPSNSWHSPLNVFRASQAVRQRVEPLIVFRSPVQYSHGTVELQSQIKLQSQGDGISGGHRGFRAHFRVMGH